MKMIQSQILTYNNQIREIEKMPESPAKTQQTLHYKPK